MVSLWTSSRRMPPRNVGGPTILHPGPLKLTSSCSSPAEVLIHVLFIVILEAVVFKKKGARMATCIQPLYVSSSGRGIGGLVALAHVMGFLHGRGLQVLSNSRAGVYHRRPKCGADWQGFCRTPHLRICYKAVDLLGIYMIWHWSWGGGGKQRWCFGGLRERFSA